MRWSRDAEEAISKVPFFVRRRVKKKIEFEAQAMGATEVTLQHVHTVKQNFMRKMEDDIKGYQIESCFGSSGCPNRIPHENDLPERAEEILIKRDLKTFLKSKVNGPLKFHHEFRVSFADCPNACSRPQISDVGIVVALAPVVVGSECTQCGLCAETCLEKAVTIESGMNLPSLDFNRCVYCGQCIKSCPNETLARGKEGFRIMIGGKLGRHPRLATGLDGIFSRGETLELFERILGFFCEYNHHGERLGEMVERVGVREVERMLLS